MQQPQILTTRAMVKKRAYALTPEQGVEAFFLLEGVDRLSYEVQHPKKGRQHGSTRVECKRRNQQTQESESCCFTL